MPNHTMVGKHYKIEAEEGTDHVVAADIVVNGKSFRLSGFWYIQIRKQLPKTLKPFDQVESCRFYADMKTPIIRIGCSATMGIECFIQCLEEGYFTLVQRGSQPHVTRPASAEATKLTEVVKQNGHLKSDLPSNGRVRSLELITA